MRLRWPRAVREWGSTAGERRHSFPCDVLVERPDDTLFRAVDVAAPASTVFRWLCQLRVAPYSYDKLDNWGRRSPQTLSPGLERLQPGQRFMTIFRLVEFEQDSSLTLLHEGRLFGRAAVTYRVEPAATRDARLVVKILVARPARRRLAAVAALMLAPGDLVMMRRQLLNLKRLAEAT